jgi:tetratricopeptide (TPR) repeat protein
MKYLYSLLVVAVTLHPLHAGGTLKEARIRLLRGNYAEAQEIYTELAKNDKTRVEATIGLSQALESEGNYDEALTAVEKVLKTLPDNADLLARRGELLYLRGRWDEAEKSARQALAKNGEHFPARWVLGQVLRDRGELGKADDEFRWFVKTYTKRSNDDMEITDPDLLHLVGLAGSERARTDYRLKDQFQFILDDIYAESVKKDKDFWWGEYEAGRLFLDKFNKAAADRAFDKALVINPRAADVLACKGLAAMLRLELKDAEQYADQALLINPRLPTALRLKADIFLFSGDVAKAMTQLDKARAVNPRDELTLARVAACLTGSKKKAEFDALVKEVEKNNSKPAVFFSEFASLLDGKKNYDEAEKYYQRSIALQPKLAAGHNGLGLLYMRLGKEPEAMKALEAGAKADSFNILVVNSLKVLDHLAKYASIKTEHFIIRFDPKNDKVLANFVAKYSEDIYEELAAKFQYRPKGPFLIEVFNRHEMFSGRVVALPDLHTIGACTGSVIAMCSPRDKSKVVGKPFNWNRVIRHELVHVFNLDQTRFQVPHWLTEGLAVSAEGTAPPPRWKTLLADKMRAGELLNLDTILLGFIRPRTPDEWQLAYLQSQLYVEYAVKTHGDKAVGALLAAFAEDRDTAGALEKALGVSKADFEKGYSAFLQERVKQDGDQLARRALTFKQLQEAHAKDPDDADVAAQLADRFYQQGKKKEARELADKVLVAKGRHPLAACVKALLLIDGGDEDLAIALLSTNVDDKTTDPKALKVLSRIQMQTKKFNEAARTMEQGRAADPNDTTWLTDLVKLYTKELKDDPRLADVLKELVKQDPDELPARRKLAKALLEDGKLADAEVYARQVLEIDVLDAEGQRILLEALMGQNKDEQVRQLKKLLE